MLRLCLEPLEVLCRYALSLQKGRGEFKYLCALQQHGRKTLQVSIVFWSRGYSGKGSWGQTEKGSEERHRQKEGPTLSANTRTSSS